MNEDQDEGASSDEAETEARKKAQARALKKIEKAAAPEDSSDFDSPGIGNVNVDLSNYYDKLEITDLLAG